MALSLHLLRRALPLTLTLKSFPKTQTLADPNRWKDGGIIMISNSLVKRYSSAPSPPIYSRSGRQPTESDFCDKLDDGHISDRFVVSHPHRNPYQPRDYRDISRVPGIAIEMPDFKEDPKQYHLMKELAALALKEYTRQTDDIYDLVDIDKVNYRITNGVYHYITFKAKSQKESETFEAEVWHLSYPLVQINSVRIKKPASKWSDGMFNVPSYGELRAGWSWRNCRD